MESPSARLLLTLGNREQAVSTFSSYLDPSGLQRILKETVQVLLQILRRWLVECSQEGIRGRHMRLRNVEGLYTQEVVLSEDM